MTLNVIRTTSRRRAKLSPYVLMMLIAVTVVAIDSAWTHATAESRNSTVVAKMARAANRASIEQAIHNPRIASERFAQHVRFAREALANNNNALAGEHINYAMRMVKILKASTSRIQRVNLTNSTSDAEKYLRLARTSIDKGRFIETDFLLARLDRR